MTRRYHDPAMTIPTYFSHSYRLEDQPLNQHFWRLFSEEGFSFFVDPQSDTTIHTHLERMMRRCSAFVAVVNRRRDVSRFFCSRFILYEYGLSIQAQRPRLMLVDRRVHLEPFKALQHDDLHVFAPEQPDKREDELSAKIERLREVSQHFPNSLDQPRKPIAILVPQDRSRCAYADPDTLHRIEEVADLHGFRLDIIGIPFEHNAFFALALEEHEAVILDVRGDDMPEWVFAYLYGRLVPTIKLARLQPSEFPWSVQLPPLVVGLRMDENEPAVESVTYWRDQDDLVFQLAQAFQKLDEEETAFKDGRQGELYFESIGRRTARIFISNSGNSNPLARRLSEELRLRNISQFQYKEPGAIPAGTDWKDKIRGELQSCDVFVGLIGKGYVESNWCMEEMRAARARLPGLDLLPYKIGDADVAFMDELQVSELPADPGEALSRILADIQSRLTAARGIPNGHQRRATLLGGSREVIVDSLRHLPDSGWSTLLKQMEEFGISSTLPRDAAVAIRSREFAEQFFAQVQRVDSEPGHEKEALLELVEGLAGLCSGPHRRVMTQISARLAQGGGNDG